MSGKEDLHTLILMAKEIRLRRGEDWHAYRRRVAERLHPVRRQAARAGLQLSPLLAANALCGECSEEVADRIRSGVLGSGVSLVEWGEKLGCEQVHVAFRENEFGRSNGRRGFTGRGVSVAVLDSGIDARHPWLKVAGSVSTCPEPAGVPGWHGTYCAGIIASQSSQFPGIAPGVRLLDIKVSESGGWLHPAWLARGIDAALDSKADILSISVGVNCLPSNVVGGHGWNCPDGRCLLCRAVDHAVGLGVLVVAAAGNEHLRVRRLRNRGIVLAPAAELLCPGSARRALSVGAILSLPSPQLWPHSSRGPSGSGRPDILAPGVGLASTVILPDERRETDPLVLFGTGTGTSVATAVAAGAAALVCERRYASGLSVSPRSVRGELRTRCCTPLRSKDGETFASLDLSALVGESGRAAGSLSA